MAYILIIFIPAVIILCVFSFLLGRNYRITRRALPLSDTTPDIVDDIIDSVSTPSFRVISPLARQREHDIRAAFSETI